VQKYGQWVLTLTYNNYEKVYKNNNCNGSCLSDAFM